MFETLRYKAQDSLLSLSCLHTGNEIWSFNREVKVDMSLLLETIHSSPLSSLQWHPDGSEMQLVLFLQFERSGTELLKSLFSEQNHSWYPDMNGGGQSFFPVVSVKRTQKSQCLKKSVPTK